MKNTARRLFDTLLMRGPCLKSFNRRNRVVRKTGNAANNKTMNTYSPDLHALAFLAVLLLGVFPKCQPQAQTTDPDGLAESNFDIPSPSAVNWKGVYDVTGLQALTKQGLRAEYYNNKNLTNLRAVRVDANVDFHWALASPWPGTIQPNTFSVRWAGYLVPRFSEAYNLIALADDGVRLWLSDELVIDYWHDQRPHERVSRPINFIAGHAYRIRLEFYENGGGATISLRWPSAHQSKEAIPSSQLFAPPPRLAIQPLTRNRLRISWPHGYGLDYELKSSERVPAAPNAWLPVCDEATVEGNEDFVVVESGPATCFYELFQKP